MASSLAILIRRLFWIITGVALVIFAVNNRQITEISLAPMPFSISMPVWGLVFIGIFIGLIVSATVTGWIRLKGFTKRRKAERRADYLDGQMAAMTEDAHHGRAAKAHQAASDTENSTSVTTGLAKDR